MNSSLGRTRWSNELRRCLVNISYADADAAAEAVAENCDVALG
jgi:hypothetical protein